MLTSYFIFLHQALSLVKQQKRELLHKDSVIRILTTQRDESAATLARHGLSVLPQIPSECYLVYCRSREGINWLQWLAWVTSLYLETTRSGLGCMMQRSGKNDVLSVVVVFAWNVDFSSIVLCFQSNSPGPPVFLKLARRPELSSTCIMSLWLGWIGQPTLCNQYQN